MKHLIIAGVCLALVFVACATNVLPAVAEAVVSSNGYEDLRTYPKLEARMRANSNVTAANLRTKAEEMVQNAAQLGPLEQLLALTEANEWLAKALTEEAIVWAIDNGYCTIGDKDQPAPPYPLQQPGRICVAHHGNRDDRKVVVWFALPDESPFRSRGEQIKADRDNLWNAAIATWCAEFNAKSREEREAIIQRKEHWRGKGYTYDPLTLEVSHTPVR